VAKNVATFVATNVATNVAATGVAATFVAAKVGGYVAQSLAYGYYRAENMIYIYEIW